jgi:ubiquinone/menaquinone biosynthesis C-methylase UbiE/uncharacterized protein YbaR (Trm112 family)
MPLDLSRIQCPACSGQLNYGFLLSLQCVNCSQAYPIQDGVPVLKTDIETDSALDLEQYELEHPIDPERRAKGFLPFGAAMQKYGIESGACLEIGSGTGNLTDGLVHQSSFSEVHCSDISARFLNRLRVVLKDDPKLRYWLFDASRLPFKSESMDAVFAQSVLHHILDYEGALADVHRILKPGGLAMFGEPVMDNKAITAYCAGLILQIESKAALAGFTEDEIKALRGVKAGAPMFGKKMRDSRQELAKFEDKHIFVVGEMHKLSTSIGFRDFEYNNVATIDRIGNDHYWAIKSAIERVGGSIDKLKPYNFIFSELTETYGAAMGPAAPFNFGHFVFRK